MNYNQAPVFMGWYMPPPGHSTNPQEYPIPLQSPLYTVTPASQLQRHPRANSGEPPVSAADSIQPLQSSTPNQENVVDEDEDSPLNLLLSLRHARVEPPAGDDSALHPLISSADTSRSCPEDGVLVAAHVLSSSLSSLHQQQQAVQKQPNPANGDHDAAATGSNTSTAEARSSNNHATDATHASNATTTDTARVATPKTAAAKTTAQKAEPTLKPIHHEKWLKQYNNLIEFKKEHGHCFVPIAYKKVPTLSHWIKRQRNQYKKKIAGDTAECSGLTDERQKILDDIGFIWDSHQALWDLRVRECQLFVQVNGHCFIPVRYPPNQILSAWAKCQRRQFRLQQQGRKNTLTKERVDELNRLGFAWDGTASGRYVSSIIGDGGLTQNYPPTTVVESGSTVHQPATIVESGSTANPGLTAVESGSPVNHPTTTAEFGSTVNPGLKVAELGMQPSA